MNKVPDSANMVFNLFRKRKCFSDQPRDALSQRAIETFNFVCFASFFTYRAMSLGRKNPLIGFPKIGITDRTLTINTR